MTAFYLDTSAIAKFYLTEIGSAWVRSLVTPTAGHVIIVCDTTPIEMASLLARRYQDQQLSLPDSTLLYTAYMVDHRRHFLAVSFSDSVLTTASALPAKHGTRALDSLQLAAAIEAATILGEPLTFVSADVRLLAAAAAEGFTTDNPLNHP